VSAVVHGGDDGDDLALAEVADADGGVGAVGHCQSPRVRGLELAGGWACGELGVPEDGRGRRQLVGNAQSRARVVGRGRGCGGVLRRFGGGWRVGLGFRARESQRGSKGAVVVKIAIDVVPVQRLWVGSRLQRVAMSRLGGAIACPIMYSNVRFALPTRPPGLSFRMLLQLRLYLVSSSAASFPAPWSVCCAANTLDAQNM
jgi:hypothetical protein